MHAVRKRLESNIKCRKSSRLTIFDKIRNLPRCDSPKKQPDPLTKEEHRRMQLEKWKEEKEKKKKQEAAQKKKPFVAGVAHVPMKFVPPPPLKSVPSTSGRVTRSQTAKKNSSIPKPSKTTPKEPKIQSFAPKNASFKAPEIKNIDKVPKLLVSQSKTKKTKETIVFNPVVPAVLKVNSKTKLKTQPNITENNRIVTEKPVKQLEKRNRGKLMKVESSSSSQNELSSADKPSPVSQRSKLKTRTPKKPVQTSSEDISPDTTRPLPKTKASRKPIKSSENKTSPVSDQILQLNKTPHKSNDSNKFSTPRNVIPKSESNSEQKLRSPKSPVDEPLTPEQIVEEAKRNSPFVTLSRGKCNARRETMKKIDEGLFECDASDVDSVDHFRRQLNSEIKRMTEMCNTWEKILEQIVLPESVQEAVLGATGQARLLMSHKLQQFASLVARCERPEPGQPLVTPADLHGFWDMVFMQVENVDMRFKKLEELRARDWVEEAPPAPRPPPARRAKPGPKPAASRLRDVIAAARKAKKQESAPEAAQDGAGAEAPARTFEAGFFCVQSPERAPRPARPSLLKAVLSSEAKKSATKSSTSLAMLRASLIGKNVESNSPVADSPVPNLTPINLHATPARSILKPVSMPSTNKSGKKSIKVVLFGDYDNTTDDAAQKELENHKQVNGVEKLDDANTDSGVSSMDIEKDKEQKENKSRKKSLVRQDAVGDTSPVMTRSRRKSMPAAATEDTEKTPKRTSRRKKALQEVELNIVEEKNPTPKRSSRRKSVLQSVAA